MTKPTSQHNPTPTETVWQSASQWFGRTLAATLLMVGPGILGAFLDRRFGTNFLAATGFIGGLVLGTAGLIVLAQKFTPPARGQALPWEDESAEEGELPKEDNRKV
jgi:hypothetical protein